MDRRKNTSTVIFKHVCLSETSLRSNWWLAWKELSQKVERQGLKGSYSIAELLKILQTLRREKVQS